MTQQQIDWSAPVAQAEPRSKVNARLAAFFREHPNEWVSAFTIIAITGQPLAFRTRISNVRLGYGMTIDNQLRTVERGKKASYYRYVQAGEQTERVA
jgi:hypothetical protein